SPTASSLVSKSYRKRWELGKCLLHGRPPVLVCSTTSELDDDRSTGGPGKHVEVLHVVPRRDRDALRPESRDLPAADGSQLGGADDPVGGYDPEPGKSLGFLDRESRENEGNLAGRHPQVPS